MSRCMMGSFSFSSNQRGCLNSIEDSCGAERSSRRYRPPFIRSMNSEQSRELRPSAGSWTYFRRKGTRLFERFGVCGTRMSEALLCEVARI